VCLSPCDAEDSNIRTWRRASSPSNPSYTVAISDEMAAAARDRAAKDADTTRLHPKTAAQSEEFKVSEKSGAGGKPLSPISDDMAAGALNGMRLSEEADSYDVVRTQNDTRSTTGKGSANLELQRARTHREGDEQARVHHRLGTIASQQRANNVERGSSISEGDKGTALGPRPKDDSVIWDLGSFSSCKDFGLTVAKIL